MIPATSPVTGASTLQFRSPTHEMNQNLWLKLSFNTRCVAINQETARIVSQPSSSGPIWIGLLASGELRATFRWDVPAGHQPALPIMRAELLRHIEECERWAPANTRSSGTLNIGANTRAYGYALDGAGQRALDNIDPKNMEWIVGDEMVSLYKSSGLRTIEDTLAVTRALVLAGVPTSLMPEGNDVNYGNIHFFRPIKT